MYKKISLEKLSFSLILVALVSCTKKTDPDPNSAAFKIDASEKLDINTVASEIALPENLPNGNERVATYYASGVQMYKAQATPGTNPATYTWVFVAPKADLYDHTNVKVGTHYVGPTWKLTSLTDSIVAQQFSPAKKKTVDTKNIDWLQLTPKDGTTPKGIFKDVVYVQRIATTGGIAPSDPPTSATQTADVAYTAIYRFAKKK